ncbi:MAG: tetratricopeptide repeat protein [Myxococcota bacterium]
MTLPIRFRTVSAIALTGVLLGSSLLGCKYKDPDAESSEEQAAEQDDSKDKEPAETKPAPEGPKLEGESEQGDGQPTDPSALPEGTEAQLSLLTRAKSAFLSGRMDEAERLFEQLTETGPISGPRVSAYIALGQIYNESGRTEEAVALYEGLADKVEDVPEVQIVVARSLADQGETTKAIEAYRKLLNKQPDYIFALIELAELYDKAGRDEKSAKTLYTYEQKIYSMAEQLGKEDSAVEQKLHVLDVFSMVSDDKAVDASVGALKDPNPAVRAKAAVVLEQMGAVEAVDILETVADKDPNRRVRLSAKTAARALSEGKSSDKKIGPTFVEDEVGLPK